MDQRMNAEAVYVCDTDPARSRRYPFREGQSIPRTIEEAGVTFSLRVVTYEAEGLEITRAVPDVAAPDLAAIDAQQARVRAWNATRTTRDAIVADVIANDTATAGEAA